MISPRERGRPKTESKMTTVWVSVGNVNRLKRCFVSEQRKMQSEGRGNTVKTLNDALTILLDLKECCDVLLHDISMTAMVEEIRKTTQEKQKTEEAKQ